MDVKKIVSSEFISIPITCTIAEVFEQFSRFHHNIACVIENDQLIGIVTKYSLYRLLLKTENIYSTIESAIIENPVTVYDDYNVYETMDKLIQTKVAHAVVLNRKEKVVGIISSSNIFEGFINETKRVTQQLSSLMNTLQSVIISVDLDLNITTLNNSAKKLLNQYGLKPNNDHIGYLFPELTNYILQVIESNEQIDYESIDIFDKNYICSFIPIQAWNEVTGVMIVLDEVSKYEKIAKELESTKLVEQTLDSALEVAYDAIVITDTNGIITKVNKGFYELLKLSQTENLLGKSLKSLVPEIPIEKSILNNEDINGEYIEINGYKTIVTQNIIYRNNEQLGVMVKILYQQLERWKDLFDHMNQLETLIPYYQKKSFRTANKDSYFEHIISVSNVMEKLKNDALVAAKGFSNVLITGESGTGKDLFAQGIHRASGRKGNFVKINCAAIPKDLLESELFGYEDGAFTGAKKGGKPGKFELAHNGTLFLDEIGDMPISLQAKLLRVLQDQKFERVGGIETKYVNVRIITATNRDLLELIKQGKFREDLYYRINVIHLHLPPLRERKEDISYLCSYFIKKFNEKMNKNIQGIHPDVLDLLLQYDWPGNIRELENILERAFHFCTSEWIRKSDININPVNSNLAIRKNDFFVKVNNIEDHLEFNHFEYHNLSKDILSLTEKELIIKALQKANGNRSKAAKLLNISRSTLYYKLKKYNIKEINMYK